MNEDKKTNTGGLDTAPDFENFEKADVSEELLEEANGKYRDLKGFPRYLAFGIAVATTLIIFYTAFAGVFLLHVGADFPLVPHNEKKQV